MLLYLMEQKQITIKCENLTKLNSNLNTSYVNIYVLNVVPVTVEVNGTNTDFITQYNRKCNSTENYKLSKRNQPSIRELYL